MKNLLTVLFSPTAAFEKLREKGGWAAGFVAVLLLSIVSVWLIWPLTEKMMREQFAKTNTPGNIDQIINISHYTTLLGGAFGVAVKIFVVALLLLLVNLIVRGEAKYMQLVKVSTFSSVPGLISGLLTGIMARTTDASSIQDLSISLAAFISNKSGFLYGAASLLNPFSIWGLVLMIIGTAVMARKSKSSVAVWIVLGWLVFGLIGAWTGSMFSAKV